MTENSTPVTLADIAYRAGVTKMTVSRALDPRAHRKVTPSLRERIRAIAKDLNYRPNFAAKGLQGRRSFLIGVMHVEGNARYIASMSRGLQEVLADNGLAPVVYIDSSNAEELRFLEQCLERGVEGILANLQTDADGRTNAQWFAKAREAGLAIVEINGRFIDGVPHVTADYGLAARTLTRELIDAGRRRIVLYTSDQYRQNEVRPGFFWTSNAFWHGYEQTMLEAGLKPEVLTFSMLDPISGNIESSGLMEVARASAQIPTAILCPDPRSAERISRFISTTPEAHNIREATFGDLQSLGFLPPNALRLGFPGFAIGQTAANLLLRQLEQKSEEDIAVAPELLPEG